MNLRKQHNIAGSTYGKRNGDNQQEQSDNNTGCRIIELADCCDKATVTRSGNSNGLYDQNDHLKKEDEEKHHEVEARIATERLISWPIPIKSIKVKLILYIGHSTSVQTTMIGAPILKKCTYQHINDAGVNINAYNMAKPNAEKSPA